MTNQPMLRPNFWEHFALKDLTSAEWEALCDGCGACCLVKFEDDDTGEVLYTDVACQLLDCETGACSRYAVRRNFVPDCIRLTVDNISQMHWLPATCAYKRLFLGKSLPSWHLLITRDKTKTDLFMRQNHVSVAGRCVSEKNVSELEQEERIIHWIHQ